MMKYFNNTLTIRALPLFSLDEGFILFRRESEDRGIFTKPESDESVAEFPKICCPHCRWRPTRLSLWTCWDCDYPEYFQGGCGTDWNTFETHGLCPGCSHQWIWTSCLQCGGWSTHEDWYNQS